MPDDADFQYNIQINKERVTMKTIKQELDSKGESSQNNVEKELDNISPTDLQLAKQSQKGRGDINSPSGELNFTEDFGISENDKIILDRLKANKHIAQKDNVKKKKQKEQSVNVAQPLISVSDIKEPKGTMKTFHKRGSSSPEILFDGDTTILTWQRHFIKDNQVLLVPKQIPFSTGMLELIYNTKDKVLVVKPQESNTEAAL